MSARLTQILLVSVTLILSVLLYFAPRTAPAKQELKANAATVPSGSVESYLSMALKQLPAEESGRYQELLAARAYDSLAFFWDRLRRPDLASLAIEKRALQTNSAADWMKAGNRYYYAVQFSQDRNEIPLLYESAMRCFGKAAAIDPADVQARIMLASCYVERSASPMEGISMLREIEKTDSNNVQLQLSFAFFSVKSGQFDKAIRRFRKVLEIDSSYIEAYLHLADVHERRGEIDKTIEMLEAYTSRTTDALARTEITKYIQQLKKK
jgi:tetratricopeptide (TPR) repeat protein